MQTETMIENQAAAAEEATQAPQVETSPISPESMTQEEMDAARANFYSVTDYIFSNACVPLHEEQHDPVIIFMGLLDAANVIATISGGSLEENAKMRPVFIQGFERALLNTKDGYLCPALAYAQEHGLKMGASIKPRPSVFTDQAVFMQASGQTTGTLNLEQATLYRKLVSEEFIELDEAFNHFDAHFAGMKDMPGYSAALGEVAKEACDVIVVAAGLLHSLGINPQDAWNEVMGSNLSKIDPATGTVLKRDDGKVLKGPNFRKADMTALVERAAAEK